MRNKQEHQEEVYAFLQKRLSLYDWKFSVPHGWGKESYYAHGFKRIYFVKVSVDVERYLAMAEIGLTPPVILHGQLDSGPTIIVQSYIIGRPPSRTDYRERMGDVAGIIRKMHNSPRMKEVLPAAPSDTYKEAGLRTLERLRRKWGQYKTQVPSAAGFVDKSSEKIEKQIHQFSGEGLVASHGDICNANWIFASNGKIYLVDFDLMHMDDPALDLGALLWWYYPPELRKPFLEEAGYRYDEAFKYRMQVRMAMHSMDILLPRENSFDQFKPENFNVSLRDFKALVNGQENPEGYG
jgi:hypothetical protein